MKKDNQLSILRDAPVSKALTYLALPSIATTLVMTLHNLIDTIYISALKDTHMIAATTVALAITVLVQAFGDGLGAGAGSYVGRLLGAKEEEKVNATVKTAITMSLIVSLVVMLSAVTILKPIIGLFTTDPLVLNHAHNYMRILTLGAIFVIFKQVLSYLLRSSGDVKYPMKIVFLEITINVILNPFFMFDFGLGLKIQGAALATVTSQMITTILLLYRLLHHNTVIRWRFGDFGLDFACAKEILNVGFAVFVRNGLPSLSYGLFARAAGLFGTDFVAAAGIAKKGTYVADFVLVGLGQGYQPFASFNYGAKNKERLLEGIKKAITFTTIYGLIIATIFFLFPHLIMRVITSDTNLINISKNILRFYAISLPILGIYQILIGTFQATGKGKLSFMTSILRQGVFYCPLMMSLPYVFGETGFVLVQPICDWLSMILVVFLSRSVIKEIKEMKSSQ